MITTTLCYIEKDGKYLMLHRVKKHNDINEGKWIGVGGHAENQETPEECLVRPGLPTWEGDRVFLNLLLSGEERFFSIKLKYEGSRLVEKQVNLY